MIVEEQRMGFWTGVRLPSGPLSNFSIFTLTKEYVIIKISYKNQSNFYLTFKKIRNIVSNKRVAD